MDDFGNVTRSVSVGYRRQGGGAATLPEQDVTQVTYREATFINQAASRAFYRVGTPSETRGFEVTGLARSLETPVFSLAALDSTTLAATEDPFAATPTTGVVQKRVLEKTRFLYYDDGPANPTVALPLGQAGTGTRALPFATLRMAFTKAQV